MIQPTQATIDLRRAITCLALEVPDSVWDDVSAKVEAVLLEHEALRYALEKIPALAHESEKAAKIAREGCSECGQTEHGAAAGYLRIDHLPDCPQSVREGA